MKGFAFFKSVMIQLDFAFPNFSPFLSKDIVVLLCFQPIKHKGNMNKKIHRLKMNFLVRYSARFLC